MADTIGTEKLRDDPDRLWSYEEFAHWAGVPERTARKWVADGNGPRVGRLGRHARIRVRDALDWYEHRIGTTTNEPTMHDKRAA